MIQSPRVTEYTGQEKDKSQSNKMLSLMKMTYRMRMELFQFRGHCLRGENKAEKVIQYPKNSDDDSEKPDEQHDNAEKDKSDDDQQHKTNSIPFLQVPAANDPEDKPPQPQGRPQRTARYQGNYKGMTVAAAIFDEEDVNKIRRS